MEGDSARPSAGSRPATPRFVGARLTPAATYIDSPALSQGEPPLPSAFAWGARDLSVVAVLRTWRTTKTDRGDDYLARHWYEFRTPADSTAVVYFDRKARPGKPRWWLYTIAEA